MKKASFFIAVAVTTFCFFTEGSAQTVARQSTAKAPAGDSWMPVNKFKAPPTSNQSGSSVVAAPPLTNVLNGVSFYSMKSQCNSTDVIVVKAINVNDYPVKISWQPGIGTPVESVVIPAHRNIEGDCMNPDPVRAKLVLTLPTGPDKEDIKKYFFSTISVTESKN